MDPVCKIEFAFPVPPLPDSLDKGLSVVAFPACCEEEEEEGGGGMTACGCLNCFCIGDCGALVVVVVVVVVEVVLEVGIVGVVLEVGIVGVLEEEGVRTGFLGGFVSNALT